MNEDSKLILEALAKLNKRMDAMEGRLDAMDEKLTTFHSETTMNFASVDEKLNTLHDLLSEHISDVDAIVTQNCKDITKLRSRLA